MRLGTRLAPACTGNEATLTVEGGVTYTLPRGSIQYHGVGETDSCSEYEF